MYANIDYRDELMDKFHLESKLLGRYGRVYPVLPADPVTGYRCKVQAVCGTEAGKLVTGIYRRGTHKLIPVKRCMVEDERAAAILNTIRTLSGRYGISSYDEDLFTGDLT